MRQPALVRLGWSQLAALAGGFAGVLCVLWITFMWEWHELYMRHVVVPHLEVRYGFQTGKVTFSRNGTTSESTGVVRVAPGGPLDRLGFQVGDVPFRYHGNGWSGFAAALNEYERRRPAALDVLNAAAWNAGRGDDAFRTIQLRAR